MPKEHLSDQRLKSIPNPEKRIEYYDDHLIEAGKLKKKGVKGLAVRVTPTGKKSFVYRYWYNEKAKRFTIGSYPDWTLTDARDKARELSKIVSEGKDPAAAKLKEKSSKPVTLGEYVDRFINDYVKRKLKASTQKTYTSRLNKIKNNGIAKKPLNDISRAEIRHFLKSEAKDHPTNANRLHSILSKMFNEAIEDGLLAKNPIKGMDKLSNENSRDVRYSDKEIKDIWDAISDEHPSMKGLLKTLLITGQRLGETSRMRWEDVDLENALWTIPKSETKGDRTHDVPLPRMALKLIQEMKSMDSEYVFPSIQDNQKHLSHFFNAMERIREITGLKDFRIHDLRHIAATGMIEVGVDFIHVGKVLNHKELARENAITSRYINTDFKDQKKRALDVWAGKLTEIISPLSAVQKKTS